MLFNPTLVLFPEGEGVSSSLTPAPPPSGLGDPKLDLRPPSAGLKPLPCNGLGPGEYGEWEALAARLARLEAELATEPEMEGVRE